MEDIEQPPAVVPDPLGRFEEFIEHFRAEGVNYAEDIRNLSIENKRSLRINMEDIFAFDPDFARRLFNEPSEMILLIERAIISQLRLLDPDHIHQISPLYIPARFYNIDQEHTINLRHMNVNNRGKLIAVRGIINSINVPQMKIIRANYLCLKCNERFFIEQDGMLETKPTNCSHCHSKGPLVFDENSSEYVDWQRIRIQEHPEDLPAGQLPRTLEITLTRELVDVARAGSRVVAIGILIARRNRVQNANLNTFNPYMIANNIYADEEVLEDTITEADEREILQLSQDPNIYTRVYNSIAPSIYGLAEIKQAIAHLIFGGSTITLPDGMRIRGDSHILLVGDPSTGKSQLLQSVKRISPRCLYTSGKGTTAAGLTATVSKEKDTQQYSLTAGALVIADKGICCIDEFDKMTKEDRSAIHEAMEQQIISIAKAGIIATLNARTTILAAANPKFGKYDTYKNVAENLIQLPPSILTRFDLIFILIDLPEPQRDSFLSDHILALHQGTSSVYHPAIEYNLLKKYIKYARQNINPVLSNEARVVIHQFYLSMRGTATSPDSPIPVTARHEEGLIRISEAHARIALRRNVTVDDANYAIGLMRFSLLQAGIDPATGRIDSSAVSGTPTSQRARYTTIEKIVRDMFANNSKKPVKREDVMREIIAKGISEQDAENDLEHLISAGVLMTPIGGKTISIP